MANDVYLRRVEISDLSTLLLWENDPNNWEVSEIKQPFSEEEIADFIVNQQAPYNALDQIRWMICLKSTHEAIGTIDLFEIQNNQAGIGILIQSTHHRNNGYATQAIELLKTLAKEELKLNRLFCNIQHFNLASIHLFEKCQFKQVEKFEKHAKYSVNL